MDVRRRRLGIVPSLEAPHLDTQDGFVVVVVAVWLVVFACVLQDVRTVRVGRKVQMAHGCWRT